VSGESIHGRVVELEAAGRPFALATVVAVQRPTSAKPGSSGIVHADGTIEGWVGGSCAQPVVVREALLALADGRPRLLRLSKDGPSEARRGDGVIELVMSCHSGGTLEIYVEPHLPAPIVWIAGITPIALALAELASGAGFDVTVFDPDAEGLRLPARIRTSSETALDIVETALAPYIVVATQGQWDEEALLGALHREARYVGLVASPTRAAVVRTFLRDEAVPLERLAALRAPAGLDIGADQAGEVAISILAELVQVRRGRADFVAAPGPATIAGPSGEAQASAAMDRVDAGGEDGGIVLTDPVCGMTVRRDRARHLAEHGGLVYAFCCLDCRTRFVRDPGAFVGAGATVPEGTAQAGHRKRGV
jgi:xanthine dehydrogenase accessory factor